MAVVVPKTIIISSVPGKSPAIRSVYTSHQSNTPTNMAENLLENGPRKRRRLTHLTPDERMMRRKLKNRVAAQTARDRKKERMTELEEALAQIEAENKRLQSENVTLKQQTGALSEENVHLRLRLGINGEEEPKAVVTSSVGKHGSPGSAAGTDPCSLQGSHPVPDSSSVSEPDILLGLLQQITDSCEVEDTPHISVLAAEADVAGAERSVAQTAGRPSLQVVGPTAAELDSIKELIQFDHEYFKAPTETTETSVPASSKATDDNKDDVKVQIMKVLQDKITIAPKQKPVLVSVTTSPSVSTNAQLVSIVSPNLKRSPGKFAARKRATCTVTVPQPQPTPAKVVQNIVEQTEPLDLSTPTSDPEGFNLNLNEVDITALTDSLEQLIDLDSLLDGDNSGSGTQVSGDSTCIDSFIAEDEPVPKRRKTTPVSVNFDDSFVTLNEITKVEEPVVSSIVTLNEITKVEEPVVSSIKAELATLDLPQIWSDSLPISTSPIHGLSPDFTFASEIDKSQRLSSGYGSDISDIGSPVSDNSSSFLEDSDSLWQESFTELFPSLV